MSIHHHTHAAHPTIPKVVKLEPGVKKRLDRLGKLKQRTPHWLMKEAIIRYIEEEEYAEKLKQETVSRWQEAETGKTVSHKAMLKWLESWGTEHESGRPPCGK